MKVLKVQKAEVLYVETDEPQWFSYIRDENGRWHCARDFNMIIDKEKQKLLEEACIDYVERTFNGCA